MKITKLLSAMLMMQLVLTSCFQNYETDYEANYDDRGQITDSLLEGVTYDSDFEGVIIIRDALTEMEVLKRLEAHYQLTNSDYEITSIRNMTYAFGELDENYIISYVDDPNKIYIYDLLEMMYADSSLAHSDDVLENAAQYKATGEMGTQFIVNGEIPQIILDTPLPYTCTIRDEYIYMYDYNDMYIGVLTTTGEDELIPEMVKEIWPQKYASRFIYNFTIRTQRDDKYYEKDYLSAYCRLEEGEKGVYYLNLVLENTSSNIMFFQYCAEADGLMFASYDINSKFAEGLTEIRPQEKRMIRKKFINLNEDSMIDERRQEVLEELKAAGYLSFQKLEITNFMKQNVLPENSIFYLSYECDLEDMYCVNVLTLDECKYLKDLRSSWLADLCGKFYDLTPPEEEGRYRVTFDPVESMMDDSHISENLRENNADFLEYTIPTERIQYLYPELYWLYEEINIMADYLENQEEYTYEQIREQYILIYEDIQYILSWINKY